MASKRRLRWKQCEKKKRYENIDEARAKAIDVSRKLGMKMWAYGCHWCSGYHIGHVSRRFVTRV